jgi:hypothetical protein
MTAERQSKEQKQGEVRRSGVSPLGKSASKNSYNVQMWKPAILKSRLQAGLTGDPPLLSVTAVGFTVVHRSYVFAA